MLILIILYPVASFGTTYYVSKSGNNTNPGTPSQPWATIQKAASTMVAGDTVYVRAGTYYEQVTLANSGTSSAKITYAAYPGETPIIDGTGVTPFDWNWGGLFYIGNKSHIVVNGLTIQNAFVSSGSPGVAGILMENSGDNTITNCVIYNTRSSGIGVWNSTNSSNAKTYITYNNISQAVNGGIEECISIGSSSYVDVSYNAVHGGVNLPDGGEGIDVKEASSYVDIHHNTVYDLPGDVAIYVDAYSSTLSNVNVYSNSVYDVGYGIGIACEQGGTANNISIYNNVVRTSSTKGIELTAYGNPTYNMVKIYNNTVAYNGQGINIDTTAITGVEVYNNISASNTSYQMQAASSTNVTTSYNLWYGAQGTHKGTNYLTINPGFVSATDLHLQSISPAIDVGTKGPDTDKDGVARPQGSEYDMGAYEYVLDDGPPKAPTGLKFMN